MKKKSEMCLAVFGTFLMLEGSSLFGTLPVMAAENSVVNANAVVQTESSAGTEVTEGVSAADGAAGETAAAEANGTGSETAVTEAVDAAGKGAVIEAVGAEAETAAGEADGAAGETTAAEADGAADETAAAEADGTADETAAAADGAADGTTADTAGSTKKSVSVDLSAIQDYPNLMEVFNTLVEGGVSEEDALSSILEALEEGKEDRNETTKNSSWTGSVLTRSSGINYGPSGKETYYNLNMSRVVDILHDMGYEGDYWIRDDGVKMFGDYVLCAADLKKHKRGSLVETSLGTAIVADTGYFTKYGVAVDIAVTW